MNSEVSLEYQTFWTHPRKRLNAHNRPSEFRSSTPRTMRRSSHEQICTFDRELPSGCNDVDTDRNHNDAQSGRLVRFSDGLLGQEFAAEDLMHIARQQAATMGPALEATQSAYARASPPASDTDCFSTSPSASRSTPATVYDNDIPLDHGIDVPFPLDPALLGTSIDAASNDDARIDTASLVEAGEDLTSYDTPAMISCGSTPNVAVAAAGLPKRAMRSLSCPRAQIGSHEAANSHRRLCKSMSPVHENSMPDVGSRSPDDVSRGLQEYSRDSQLADDFAASPPPKRVRLERFSQDEGRLRETSSRPGSADRTMRQEIHPTTAGASASSDDVHDESAAKFEEWPLHNVLLKRVTSNGVATFQLQFDWNLCATHSQLGRTLPKKQRKCDDPSRSNAKADDPTARAKYSPDEDNFIISLKEELQLSWREIHREHAKKFSTRSKVSLQVRYCTKLKSHKSP